MSGRSAAATGLALGVLCVALTVRVAWWKSPFVVVGVAAAFCTFGCAIQIAREPAAVRATVLYALIGGVCAAVVLGA